jgi:glucokinase
MKTADKPIVAVDVGGTKFIASVIDKSGKMLSRVYCPTLAHQGPKKVIKRLAATIQQSVKESGAGMKGIGGISLAIAGIIDISRGLITEAPNLPDWRNIRLDSLLEAEFKIPAFLLNDASAAALGERCFGAGIGIDNLIYITVSTGIGGGLIINGELYNGADGSAAEIGHMIILADGPACNCGQHGCLEALASGSAIAILARDRLIAGEQSILMDMVDGIPAAVTAEHVTIAGRKRDIVALSVIWEAAYYLGIGLSNLVNLFNPQVIVIGGGVSTMGEMLLRPARKSMREHAFRLPASTVRVVKSKLSPDSGILGAAAYARLKLGGM